MIQNCGQLSSLILNLEKKNLEKKAIQGLPYLEACLKHSSKSLLDVEINCAELLSWNSQVGSGMLSTLFEFFPGVDVDRAHRWADAQDWNIFYRSPEEEDLPNYYSHFTNLLLCFDNDDVRARLGDLKFILPEEDDVGDEVLDVFTGPMPNLRVLSLQGYADERRGPVFHNLDSLKSFVAVSSGMLGLMDHIPTRLQHLEIDECWNEDTLPILNSLKELVTLKVVCTWAEYPFPNDQSRALELPKLEFIHFRGWFEPTSCITFHLPALKHLYLEELESRKVWDHCPKIRAFHVHWSIDRTTSEADQEALLKHHMEQVMLKYCFATHIYVPVFAKHACIEVISQLKDQGILNVALETVAFELDSSEVEDTIKIDDI